MKNLPAFVVVGGNVVVVVVVFGVVVVGGVFKLSGNYLNYY